jgi:hypothetical protein
MTSKEDDIVADDRAYARSLREHERYAQRERAEAEAFKAEKIRLAANERVFGKKYRNQSEIAADNALEAFLSAPFRVAAGDGSSQRTATSSSAGSSAEGAALHEHVAEECAICSAGAELEHFADAAAVAATATLASTASTSTSEAAAAIADSGTAEPQPVASPPNMALWCPEFRELEVRAPSNRAAAKKFLARYQRGLLREDSDGEELELELPPPPAAPVYAPAVLGWPAPLLHNGALSNGYAAGTAGN